MGSSRPVRRQPLLPGRWQPAAIAVTAVSVIGFTTMATAYRFQERAGRLDTLIAKPLIGNAAFDWGFLRDITTLGAPWTVAMMSGLLMLVAAGVGSGWRQVVLAGMGPAAATLLAEFALKPLVDRRFRGDLAFPSGHATGVAAVAATAVVIVVAGRVGGRLTRAAMSLVAAVVVAAVSTSLVALDEHYATDVIGGVLVAVGTVSALALALDRCAATPGREAAAAARPEGNARPNSP